MKNLKARSFVSIMIIIALTAFFLRIALQQVIKLNIAQNESGAQTTLKLISVALENYSKNNQGVYPASLATLTKTHPVYLDQDYISRSPLKGYVFSCFRLEPSGYSCSALPLKCKLTGNAGYTVTTGGLFIAEDCSKKESD